MVVAITISLAVGFAAGAACTRYDYKLRREIAAYKLTNAYHDLARLSRRIYRQRYVIKSLKARLPKPEPQRKVV